MDLGNGAAAAARRAAAAAGGDPNGSANNGSASAAVPRRSEAGDLVDLNSLSSDLLHCQNCRQIFADPCLLACYHTVCARCMVRSGDPRQLVCPICGYDLSDLERY